MNVNFHNTVLVRRKNGVNLNQRQRAMPIETEETRTKVLLTLEKSHPKAVGKIALCAAVVPSHDGRDRIPEFMALAQLIRELENEGLIQFMMPGLSVQGGAWRITNKGMEFRARQNIPTESPNDTPDEIPIV